MNIDYLLEQKPFNELKEAFSDEERETIQEIVDSSFQRYMQGIQQAADVRYIEWIGKKISPYAALAALEGMEMESNTKKIAYQSLAECFDNKELSDYCMGGGNVPSNK